MKAIKILMSAVLMLLVQTGPVFAEGEVQMTVQADRQEITEDESVSLKFSIRADGSMKVESINYSAPDFQTINEYTGSFVESFYENGRFGVRNNQTITKVLKPLKSGTLRIAGIEAKVNGKTYAAPAMAIVVHPGGAGTPPPRGYGGAGMGLRGSGKRAKGSTFFVRAEVNKQRAYKGEQIIVSYYLYQRVRAFNLQVDKFPMLPGFLREELEMPVMGTRLDPQNVMLDGVPYARALLARYAAYPLKEGKLTVDPLSIKGNVYSNGQNANDDEDDPFMNFFQQMAPRPASSRSEPITIEAMALPEDGKPTHFSGGVGDFTVMSAVDKYEVRANEAVTLTLKIEGKGNVASIQEPQAKWPDNVELYEAKGNSKSGRGGVGEKVFEFLLIPRIPGKVMLPALELSYFDPDKQTYVTKSTEPISIEVRDAAPGSAVVPLPKRQTTLVGQNPTQAGAADDLRYIKAPVNGLRGFAGRPWWQWLYWASIVSMMGFVGLVFSDLVRGKVESSRATRDARLLAESKSWQKLRAAARTAVSEASWQEVVQTYELLCGAVYDSIDRVYSIGARSLSRTDLRQILVDEQGLDQGLWKRIDQLFDFAEMVRFATSAGAVSEQGAREKLAHWVSEGQMIAEALTKPGPGV